MKLQAWWHDACLAHDTGPGHPERAERLLAVRDALRDALPDLAWREAPEATRAQLERVHAPAHVAAVLDAAPGTARMLDADTVLSPGSAVAALRAAGSGIAATDAVIDQAGTRAFCVVRPPGHHATATTAMGFCLFDNIAVAAAHALEARGVERVAIVDFDVHHGNGTQAIFAEDARVGYFSSHQWPLYPGTGAETERGVGNVHNAPLPPDAGAQEFRHAWRARLLPALEAWRPQLLFVSAGFDAHWRDPLAQLQLDAPDFDWLTRELAAIAAMHAGGRIVSMLEGGYDLQALRDSSVAHAQALLAE